LLDARIVIPLVARLDQDNTAAPFDVDSVEKATAELESRGYRILIRNKKEPWGQTVTRFISPEGLLVGVTVTPLMREKK
jgi:hypothetical protein